MTVESSNLSHFKFTIMSQSTNCPGQLFQFTQFLGQRVVLTVGGESWTGVLNFCGRSPLSRLFGSGVVTFTMNRLPVTVSPGDLPGVTMRLFTEDPLF